MAAVSLPISGGPSPDSTVDVDFDAHRAEHPRQRKPLSVKVSGRTFNLPPALPASVILFAMRAKKTGRADDVTADEAFELLSAVFGADMTAILRLVDHDELPDLLQMVTAAYGRRMGGQGNRPAPTRAQRRQRPQRRR